MMVRRLLGVGLFCSGVIACGAAEPSFVDVSTSKGGSTGLNEGGGGSSSVGGGTNTGGADSGVSGVGGSGVGGGQGNGGQGNGGSGVDGGTDAGPVLPPPPPPGRPGFGTVTGGAFMKGTNHSLWLTVGESPGGNNVSTSPKYKMISGVIGTSQP